MNKNVVFKNSISRAIFLSLTAALLLLTNLFINAPALAHHPSGGEIPSTFASGFLSGLGHPVVGADHLVFVIAIGLVAAFSHKLGMVVPLAFMVATAMGTGIHLQSINLPLPELVISASVLVVGIFLVKENKSNLTLLTAVGAIAGIFHGYAYGESIIGAEMTALSAYLLGFCLIQIGISAISFYVGRLIIKRKISSSRLPLRFAGFAVCGIGFAFLSSAILG